MLVFPNSKINLGLHVVDKRPDGFHNIETVFYPVNWNDVLEVIETRDTQTSFTITYSGIAIDGSIENNLIYKAWKIIAAEKNLPSLKLHLHKNIPMGAGLGGGSSDAAHFINLLNMQFNLSYTIRQKIEIAAKLGSDCAFFINNTPLLAKGKGDEFSQLHVDLSQYHILLVYPAIHCNTKEVYQGLTPKQPDQNLVQILSYTHPRDWKNKLVNDFELSVFEKYPIIGSLKKQLYQNDALYASLSGSGSTVFGIFEKEPALIFPDTYLTFLQKPLTKIL